MQWCLAHHNEFSLEGSGSKGKGKGKKRPRDDDADSDRSWQSRADSVGAKCAKLLKTVEKRQALQRLLG